MRPTMWGPEVVDAVADIEKGVVVGAGEILLQHEFFARRQKERAFVAIIGEVLIADHCAEAIKSLAGIFRLLSPLHHAHAMNFSRLSVG